MNKLNELQGYDSSPIPSMADLLRAREQAERERARRLATLRTIEINREKQS